MPSGYPKLDKLSVYQAVEAVSQVRANDIVLFTKLIVSLVGKEKAIDLIKQARYACYHKAGVERAKELGNPKDLVTYLQDTLIETNSMPPFVHRGEELYKTGKTAKVRTPGCFIARAIKAHPDADADTIDVIRRGYCTHDHAFGRGFNPEVNVSNPRSALVDPENICEFEVELER